MNSEYQTPPPTHPDPQSGPVILNGPIRVALYGI